MPSDVIQMGLGSPQVFDNAQGNASSTSNKTSIYLYRDDECIARMCNISLSNIDGNGDMTHIPDNIDDFSVGGDVLIEMVSAFLPDDLTLRMNKPAYTQLFKWWYAQKKVEQPVEFTRFGGVDILIDDNISPNEATVI